jgi:hypothetical protein
MSTSDNEAPPTRGKQHEALEVFLGRWRAEGTTFGTPKQTVADPRGAPEPWVSTHTAMWHTGKFFLIQDERATSAGGAFDTLSVMGVDAKDGRYVARTFENHGFYRHYDVDVDGNQWTFSGDTERARITFSDDGRTQTINWEWRPHDQWLPLCDRVATRED